MVPGVWVTLLRAIAKFSVLVNHPCQKTSSKLFLKRSKLIPAFRRSSIQLNHLMKWYPSPKNMDTSLLLTSSMNSITKSLSTLLEALNRATKT